MILWPNRCFPRALGNGTVKKSAIATLPTYLTTWEGGEPHLTAGATIGKIH